MIGETIGHHEILEKLGSGGMGEVYLAQDTRLRRRVALKVLPASMAAEPERLERFVREAMAVGSLNHPNIVTIYSIEEAGGLHVLAMELVEGGTLADRIPPGGLTEEQFFEIAIPLADAVSAAHDRGVTHRDIKPSNVMLTEDGRVKVVDFGLAKLRQETRARESTVMMNDDLTEAGRILGTYPYMAPEQIKGKPADHRADIFSLGVVLYEMATGERPFRGETSADLISSILRDQPPPTHEVNRDLPRHLDRIVAHCLEKDPDRRFQTAKDLRNELQSLRSEIESERIVRTTVGGTRRWTGSEKEGRWWSRLGRRKLGLAAGALLVVLAITLGVLFRDGLFRARSGPDAAVLGAEAAADGEAREERRPSVAVLFFQNLTGEAELEWLRTGLAEMIVTDLSQSPEIRVISTDRLYQVLQDLDALDRPIVSAGLVQEVARAVGAGTVLLGSYARAGETLLVNVTLQDAESGEIVDAQREQGDGVESVFSIVDRLSRSVRSSFERSGEIAVQRAAIERNIESVTTSSVEAYRLYAEGMRLNHEFKASEAIALFDRAIELDPGFAMAHARLARIYDALGREQDLEAALARAIENADRLPEPERLYVEGSYLSRKRETYGDAIAVLREAVETYPDLRAARNQLGLLYTYLEMFEPAIRELETLVADGGATSGQYNALAHAYASTGRIEDARRLLRSHLEEDPDSFSTVLVFAWHAVNWDDPELAMETVEDLERIRPGSPFVEFIRWRAPMMELRLDDAEAVADDLVENDDPFWQWRGGISSAIVDLYRGRSARALATLQSVVASRPNPDPLTGAGHAELAAVLLEIGRPAEALRSAEAAREAAAGDWPAWEGTFWAALAQQALGRPGEADALANELQAIVGQVPGPVGERLYHRLLGRLAFARGDLATARRELEQAVALLPAHGLQWHRHRFPDHGALWYELAEVLRAQGAPAEAGEQYRRLVETPTARIDHPLETVRSFYRLGQLQEARDDREAARRSYRTFLSFFEEGDVDREWVEDARRRFSALP
jgi:eukaryotic-like serine/threonine-protein kinase